MPIFNYKAIDKTGKELQGEVDASSTNEAVSKIRTMGYFPTSVFEKGKKEGLSGVVIAKSGKKSGGKSIFDIRLFGIGDIKSKDITVFTRQLSTMLAAGLPLVRALNVLSNQLKTGRLKQVIADLSEQVETGGSFSEALEKYPGIFSKLYVNSVRSGELGGVLEMVLERLADFFEKNERLSSKIRSALVYPAVVVCLAMFILVFLMIFVIPRFVELFEDIGAGLPLPTVILINISNAIREYWYLGIILAVVSVAAYKVIVKIPSARYYIDWIKLRVPLFGQIINKVIIARFSRTLGTLMPSGVPILQALDITKETCGNEVFSKSISRIYSSVREGESIAGPLGKSKVFPLMVTNMIDVGEETGALDQMLNKVADTYESEVDATVSALTSLIEPALIIIMGLIVGGIVVSMFLPLIKLLTALSV
jgi:type IV pilus assembly protein PilC